MIEFVIICGISFCSGLLVVITLTLSSISNDLFRIKKILDKLEKEE